MSIISSSHTFMNYDPKAGIKAFEGQRLAKVKYRLTEAAKARGETEKQAVCVSVPKIVVADSISETAGLKQFITEALEDYQDLLIRALHEEGKTSVHDDQISVDEILKFYASSSGSGRLSGDAIKEWFTSELEDKLQLAFAEKLGVSDTPTEEQAQKIQQISNVYRDKIAMLASPKTKFDTETIDKLEKVLELVSDDSLAQKFTSRLVEMRKNSTADLLAL